MSSPAVLIPRAAASGGRLPHALLALAARIYASRAYWLAAALLGGCAKAPPPAAPPPQEVGVITVKAEHLALVTEFPGRLNPVRAAEIRARVAGILLKRVFEEGSEVAAGQVLAIIDPAPFQASLDSAEASLAKARANLKQYEAQAARYGELAPINAVSKQDLDNALAAAAGGRADLATAQANVTTARLNLGYATMVSPIAGRIGRALVTEGALVGQSEATEIATVQQLDPIYFDFTESSTDLLRLRRAEQAGRLKSLAPGAAQVTLVLEDGSTYAHPGRLLFSDVTVDQSTGMVTLRAEIPNPERLLLPGMYARGRLEQAEEQDALTVPARGVEHQPDGSAAVLLVNDQNQVELRPVQLGSLQGNAWVVTGGLKAGDRVIVDGLQKVAPGQAVKPVPFEAAAAPAGTS